MAHIDIARFRDGIEKCLCNAARAPDREFKTLWESLADNYRYLLEHELREQERGTWEWNALAVRDW